MDVRLLCCVFLFSVFQHKVLSQNCQDGAFGVDRCYRCYCKQKAQCDKQTGACPNDACASGHYGQICQMQNMARRLRTAQSSVQGPFQSHYAVEGSYKQKDSEAEPHCIATESESMPWWTVELRKQQLVWAMRIFNNRNDLESLVGFEVYVDDELCYRDTSDAGQRTYDIRCEEEKVLVGQVVKVVLPKEGQLKFCEIEVYKCSYGFYGRECASYCSQRNCADSNDECDMLGNCPNGCKEGWWGSDCSQQCPAGCRKCGQDDGVCEECTRGLYDAAGNCVKSCSDRHCAAPRMACSDDGYCAACNEGWYGVDCSLRCEGGCTECNKKDGSCDVCKDGYYGDNCDLECNSEDRHCLSLTDCPRDGACVGECQEGWYGRNCSTPCPDNCASCAKEAEDKPKCTKCSAGYYYPNIGCARKCSDRNCLKQNDSCPFYGHCIACADGFFGHDCTRDCQPECGSCDQRNGSCITCALGFYGNHCDMVCNDTERHCAEGPEHCTISGQCPGECSPGYFGMSCNRPCDLCLTCNQTDGSCFQCLDTAKYGYYCTKDCSARHCRNEDEECKMDGECSDCSYGWYGFECTDPCPDSGCFKCNRVSGICEVCDGGTWGDDCDKPCGDCQTCDRTTGSCLECDTEGYYGADCGKMCSERHCADPDAECQIDGYCSACEDGWFGKSCSKKCFPDGCAACDKSNGGCHRCQDGHWGHACDDPCEECDTCNRMTGDCMTCNDEDNYGMKCGKTCSERHCAAQNDSCGIDGACLSCEEGWKGLDCQEECTNCVSCNRNTGVCDACENGFYGHYCKHDCPDCESCNQLNGVCETCNNETYGQSCERECSERHCVDMDYCPISGVCAETGCDDGWFGTHCDRPCSVFSSGCMRCSETECSKCMPGYYGYGCVTRCPDDCMECEQGDAGVRCTVCPAGKYGYYCEQACPEFCADSVCVNGDCLGCVPSTYGRSCEYDCPERCAMNDNEETICNQTTGFCGNGCESGFYGEMCTMNCSENCGGDKDCGWLDGACSEGCIDGFYGSICNETCTAGCESGVCDRETGLCVTEAGETKSGGDPSASASMLSRLRLDYLLAVILVISKLFYS